MILSNILTDVRHHIKEKLINVFKKKFI